MKTKLLKKLKKNFYIEYIPAYKEYVCHYIRMSYTGGINYKYTHCSFVMDNSTAMQLNINDGIYNLPDILTEKYIKRACKVYLQKRIKEYVQHNGYSKYLRSYII